MRKVRTNYDRTRWTADEIARLRELAPVYPARQVAELMGRPYPSVRAKMMREGIEACRGHNWNEWSHDELVFLEENHEAMEPEEIAARLSRTVASIKKKCWQQGISLRKKLYTDEDVRLCRELFAEGLSRDVIAEKIEVPYQRVYCWVAGRSRKNI